MTLAPTHLAPAVLAGIRRLPPGGRGMLFGAHRSVWLLLVVLVVLLVVVWSQRRR